MTYKEQVKEWLNTEPCQRDLEFGAKLMLQGNRNRILHQNVIKKSNFDKIAYELTKIMGEESRNNDQEVVAKMILQVANNETTQPEETKGKRADHDMLPYPVQSLFERNLQIYPEMRSLHERLKVMSETTTATERLPFLQKLLLLDEELRNNWNSYDKFDVNDIAPNLPNESEKPNEPIKIDAKRVSANRKYLSDNKAKLAAIIQEQNIEKATELLDKIQIRFTELIENGETFAPDQVAELKELGLNVE
jgi:hypothetical protein